MIQIKQSKVTLPLKERSVTVCVEKIKIREFKKILFEPCYYLMSRIISYCLNTGNSRKYQRAFGPCKGYFTHLLTSDSLIRSVRTDSGPQCEPAERRTHQDKVNNGLHIGQLKRNMAHIVLKYVWNSMNVVKYFTISHFPAKKAGLFKKKKLLLKDVGQLVFLQLYKFIIKLSPGYKITFYPLVPRLQLRPSLTRVNKLVFVSVSCFFWLWWEVEGVNMHANIIVLHLFNKVSLFHLT